MLKPFLTSLLSLTAVFGNSLSAPEYDTLLVSDHELPFMANVFIISIGTCNGAILSDRWIVASANCLTGQILDYDSPIVVSPTSYLVVVGTNSRAGEVSHAVQRIVFDQENGGIALIELKKHLAFNHNIQPISIGSDPPTSGMEVYSAGWIPTLRKAKMSIASPTGCENHYPERFQDQYFCVRGMLCLPEVGGPLYTREGDEYRLVGLKTNSTVLQKPETDCLQTAKGNFTSLFTHLGHRIEYIQQVTGLNRNYLLGYTKVSQACTVTYTSFSFVLSLVLVLVYS
ncbi:trypsin-like serine protease [Basidiobolus meristosporus CBS 931.73]|uniref:Trypsin-like serine protease n=1 Tax=Basidiobolus meristosporus CBS 931.73 TaxID=1314790 RepID=A0A1Y1XSL5_9FUNG|nr:trypsin-like serine protease [Basidiobolus meristosporus CBS 931.73]|eukprot:ORX88757.1 trypsin-like serine protease [Basidiobolus meristosporus CBS 931.73]